MIHDTHGIATDNLIPQGRPPAHGHQAHRTPGFTVADESDPATDRRWALAGHRLVPPIQRIFQLTSDLPLEVANP